MAEGGNTVTVRGSDAVFEYSCTPCSEDGENHEAVKYCLECKEYLCTACSKCHQKFSATKMHQLAGQDSFKHGSIQVSTATKHTKAKCPAHKERNIEMYCASHDMVYCALCVAKDHRSCSDVFEIDEAASRYFTKSDEITVAKFETVGKKLGQLKQDKIDNIQALKEEKNEEHTKIQLTKEKLINHIEKIAGEATKRVNTVHTNLTQEIENELNDIDNATETVENCIHEMKASEHLDTREQFMQQKLQKGILSVAENLLDKTCQLQWKKTTCQESDDLVSQVMNATSIMQINENRLLRSAMKVPPRLKTMSKVNVKESSDTKNCDIVGICQLSDGTIILADFGNKKLERLDGQYRVRDHCNLEAEPMGICCTGINEVAVKLRNHTVQSVSVGAKVLKTRQFDINGGTHIGFVNFADTLWSYTGGGIDIYNYSGTLLKTLTNDSFGKQLFKSTSSTYCVFPVGSDKSFVYVSDFASNVVCLDGSENVNMMLTDPKLKQIRGACISSYGILFVAGYESHNIMMFGSDGKCLGEFVAPNLDIKKPQSLCYDSQKHKLIVGCNENNDILMIDVGV